MSAPRHCPCCGADTGGEYPPSALLTLRVSPQQEATLRALIDRYPEPVPVADVVARAGGCPVGNQVQRTRMKHQLASLGWATQSCKGVVRLVRI